MLLHLFSVYVLVTGIAAQSLDTRQDNPTSIDGNCGDNSDFNATCLTSTFGNCCSEKGFCGDTSAYCSTGCQSAFGTCFTADIQSISTTGSCGATSNSNLTCLSSEFGDCCSSLGYCGSNTSYCGTGCQSSFGTCDTPTTSPTSASTPTSLPSNTNTPAFNEFGSSSLDENGDGGLGPGTRAGIISIAAVLTTMGISALIWFAVRKRKPRGVVRLEDPVEESRDRKTGGMSMSWVKKRFSRTPVFEMGGSEPVELSSEMEMKRKSRILEEERKKRVDERVAAGYDGAYRGN